MTQRFTATFSGWWVEQLADLIPASWLNIFAKSNDATILEIQGEHCVLWIRRDGVAKPVGQGPLCNLKTALKSVTDLPQLLLLRVTPEHALCKKLSLPSAARRDLKTLLGFEIDRETPFEQAEVYWNYVVGTQDKARGKLDLDLVIVPRGHADATVAAARNAGFNPAALTIDIAPDRSALIWVAAQPSVGQILRHRKLLPLVAVTGGLAAAFVILSFAGQQWNLYVANQTIADLQSRAQEAAQLQQAANQRLAAITFLSRTNGANGSALGILAAATRILPDDTYLTSISVHDSRVTMSGFSNSAASLISLLAKSPTFREPAFDSPVTESQDSDQEKFTVSMSLAPAGAL
ncbi:MAG TPA: PilN domain-containing protein [Rhizomicrobium sp.]|jgi:general secretion pathway protein L|nr:PilN domain-containing protein [Rhizomicrobium sp.]